MVRIGSKLNHKNKSNPRKMITSPNYSQVPEIVGSLDEEDSTVLLLWFVMRRPADIDFFSLAILLGLSPFAV